MNYNNKNWLYDQYSSLFTEQTGSKVDDTEKAFIKNYFSTDNDSPGKSIYYMAVYRFKRGYPKFLVHFLVFYALKIDLKKKDAPKSIQKLYKSFAKKMLQDAIKAYCKLGD